MENPESERGCNHWLLDRAAGLISSRLPAALVLSVVECESWLHWMTVADIDAALEDLGKATYLFDKEMTDIQYVKHSKSYYISILPPFLYPERNDKSALPDVMDIPLSVKLQAIGPKLKGITLTRNHLLLAAYKKAVHAADDWALMSDASKIELMADVSGLLALASNADIAANGTMCFADLDKHFVTRAMRVRGKKSLQKRSAHKEAAQRAFLEAKQAKPDLSARQFAIANYEKYGYAGHEGLQKALSKKELDKLK